MRSYCYLFLIGLALTSISFASRHLLFKLANEDERVVMKENLITKNPMKLLNLVDVNGIIPAEHYEPHIFIYIGHIIPAILWPVVSIAQFTPFFRKNYPTMHRVSGYIFLLMSVLIGTSGLYILYTDSALTYKVNPEREWTELFTFTQVGVFLFPIFIFQGLAALYFAVNKDFKQHEAFIVRHVASGMSVITMRWFLVFNAFFIQFVLNFPSEYINDYENKVWWFAKSQWEGCFVNFILAEIYIYYYINNTKKNKNLNAKDSNFSDGMKKE